MPSPSSSPPQLHSWRRTDHGQAKSPAGKWIALVVVCLLLVLLGWLLWLLLPSRLPRTHFVTIATGEAHRFVVPPIPFAQEDLAPLAPITAPSYAYHDFSRFQEAGNIRHLEQALAGLGIKQKDVLIVYVSAHGVCDDGRAYLLCRDYDLQDEASNRYAVTELLNQLKRSPAATKLLVLDAAWILTDPRLGMVANEFPVLLADDVARHEDPSLWVMLSCSQLQSPTILFTENRTAFGRSFADGLLGAADQWDRGGNEDGFISLDELFSFLRDDCNQVGGGQMPVLWRAGQQTDHSMQIQDGIQLVRADLQRPEAKEDVGADAPRFQDQRSTQKVPTPPKRSDSGKPVSGDVVDSPTKKGRPGDDGGTQRSGDRTNQMATVAQKPMGGETAADPGRDPSGADLATLLDQAWRLVDHQQSQPETTGAWSPSEYAPHQWRELVALLVDLDCRTRSGAAFDQQRMRIQLAEHVEGLLRLKENDWHGSGDRSLVINRLLNSASRFAGSPQQATFTAQSEELRAVGEAVRYYYRASFRLPYYLRCHREIALRWSDNAELQDFERLVRQLADGLIQFQQELVAREGQRLVVSAAADSLVIQSRTLRQTEDGIGRLLDGMIDVFESDPDHPAVRERIVGLLRIPIWSAVERQRLVKCLDQPLDRTTRVPDSAQSWSLSVRQWELISRHAQLQARFFELVGLPKAAEEIESLLASRSSDGRDLWPRVRTLGQICKMAHRSLRGRAQNQEQTAARWLDARDARTLIEFDERDVFPELRLLPPREPDRLDVVHRPAGSIQLDENAVAVELDFRPSNPDVQSVSVSADFDEENVQVRRTDRALRRGLPITVPVEADRTARLKLQISTLPAAKYSNAGGQYPIEFQVQAAGITMPYTLPCEVAKPNEVELLIERIDPPERARRFGRHGTELRPLVNRPNHFRMLLANLSGEAKEVHVALYRIPGSDWVPGRLLDEYGEPFADVRSWLFQPGTNRLLPSAKPIAQTSQSVTLTPNARPCEIDLSPPPPPPGDPADSPPAESKPRAKSGRTDVSYGLACVITNTELPSERWVKWIEVNPLTPREYVEPLVAYDPASERITIDVRGRDTDNDGQADRLPSVAALAEQPVEISWNTSGVVPPGAERTDWARIDRPSDIARLGAFVSRHPTQSALIRLDVDGYPRAFVYEVDLNRKNTGRDVRRDQRSIRIVSLQMRNENRVFLTVRDEDAARNETRDAEQEILQLQPNVPAAFGVPAAGDAILVGLEVDAPHDAFSFRDRSDVIEIGLTKPGFRPLQLHADRRTQVWLEEVTTTGLRMSAEVSDYVDEHAVPLNIAGLKNARVKVQARLDVEQKDPPPHELEIVLDGEAPNVASIHVPAAVRQGQPLPISVEVTDISGPAKAVFGVVQRRGEELKEEESTIRDAFAPADASGRWLIVDSLDSAMLEPGEHFAKVRITDRVGKQAEAVAPLTILAPMTKKAQAKPLIGTVRGVVRFGPNFTPDRILVRIEGTNFPPTKTSNGGRFKFDNVPAGSYSLDARGPVKGYIKSGKVNIELATKEDYDREVSIQLSDPPDDR